jgi:hypothetical protein
VNKFVRPDAAPKLCRLPALLFSTMLSSMLATPLAAQTVEEVTTPDRPVIDERGVELRTGRSNVAAEPIGVAGARFASAQSGQLGYSNFKAYVATNATSATVFVNGTSKKFSLSGSVYTPIDGDGSKLVKQTGPERYTYTTSDGTVYFFQRLVPDFNPPTIPIRAHLMTITRPDGHKTTYHNNVVSGPQNCSKTCHYPSYVRPQSITTNDGYMLKPEYASQVAGLDFNRVIGVKAIDRSVDYCDPLANSCTALTQTWPGQTIAETNVARPAQLPIMTAMLPRSIFLADWWSMLIGL